MKLDRNVETRLTWQKTNIISFIKNLFQFYKNVLSWHLFNNKFYICYNVEKTENTWRSEDVYDYGNDISRKCVAKKFVLYTAYESIFQFLIHLVHISQVNFLRSFYFISA